MPLGIPDGWISTGDAVALCIADCGISAGIQNLGEVNASLSLYPRRTLIDLRTFSAVLLY